MPPEPHLVALGWDSKRDTEWEQLQSRSSWVSEWVPARVVQTDRGEATVWTAPGVEVRVRMTKAARLVVAGDWVAMDPGADRIVEVLTRFSAFERRAARGAHVGQVLAVNMDVVAVMQSADVGVNQRRLERELVLAFESGARPLVIVSKVDQLDDPAAVAAVIAAAEDVSPGVEVIAWAAPTDIGRSALEAAIPPGATFALLGASGVGKSTLVNRLTAGLADSDGRVGSAPTQLTGETRSGDGKGRHTTTAARLIALGEGRFVIDTPGVRALALWRGDRGLALAFPEITAAADDCRFDDCVHDHEPDCAVRALVARGELDPERLDNWHRLREELEGVDS